MLHTDLPQTRSLTLVLPEEDWRALRDAEPDAVGWLQSQIRDRLSSQRQERFVFRSSGRHRRFSSGATAGPNARS